MFRYSRTLAASAVLAAALGVPVLAHAQGAGAGAAGGTTNAVIARVDGQEIRMSDISEMAQSLPEQLRNMPPHMLLPMLLDQLIDRRALAVQARKAGLDRQEDVRQLMEAAAERALQSAYVSREISPQLTDDALRTRYNRDIAGKPGAEEVRASHILVASEDLAKKVIADLAKGGNFAALAKQHSTDPGAQQGGDLGFFKKDDMVPEFSAAAFAMKPGEISKTPVKTQFGFHVIRLEERRAAPAPSFEEAQDDLRQKIIQEAYQQLTKTARAGVKVERYNADGSVPSATDTAEPPPPAQPRGAR